MKSLTDLTFVDNHIPSLLDGDYRLTVKQSLTLGDGTTAVASDDASQYLYFSVAGPRYAVDQSLVRKAFPPDQTSGEFGTVLPHMVFKRSTLPWERVVGDDSSFEAVPWVALLVFSQDEMAQITSSTTTAGALTDSTTDPVFPGLSPEVAQSDSDTVNVIDVPLSLLNLTLPTPGDLKLLAHVREVTPNPRAQESQPEAAVDITDESNLFPVIVANRLPEMGQQNYAYLVSLEDREDIFDQLGSDSETLYRLVSLYTWSFTAVNERRTFTDYLVDAATSKDSVKNAHNVLRPDLLDAASFPTEQQHTVSQANSLLGAGYSALPHRTRQGNQIVSWFRGPFLPGEAAPAPEFESLRILNQDQLVRFFSDNGMLDVSYASAWQLGQLLTLRNSNVATSLYNWKRRKALAQKPNEMSYLPYLGSREIDTALPSTVSDWFNQLLLLQPVPFNYLCPKEEMLPRESLRFFNVDMNWLEMLLDGALSVGRVSAADAAVDSAERASIWSSLSSYKPFSGFLLRSSVVSGWPNMKVEAYPLDPKLAEQVVEPGEKLVEAAKLLRMDRLGHDVLLCLFDRDIRIVDFHEVPETVHFGVGYDPKHPKPVDPALGSSTTAAVWYKGYRSTADAIEEKQTYANIEDYWNPQSRTLRISELAQALAAIGGQSEDAPTHSWWVAFEMIEGVQRVRLTRAEEGKRR